MSSMYTPPPDSMLNFLSMIGKYGKPNQTIDQKTAQQSGANQMAAGGADARGSTGGMLTGQPGSMPQTSFGGQAMMDRFRTPPSVPGGQPMRSDTPNVNGVATPTADDKTAVTVPQGTQPATGTSGTAPPPPAPVAKRTPRAPASDDEGNQPDPVLVGLMKSLGEQQGDPNVIAQGQWNTQKHGVGSRILDFLQGMGHGGGIIGGIQQARGIPQQHQQAAQIANQQAQHQQQLLQQFKLRQAINADVNDKDTIDEAARKNDAMEQDRQDRLGAKDNTPERIDTVDETGKPITKFIPRSQVGGQSYPRYIAPDKALDEPERISTVDAQGNPVTMFKKRSEVTGNTYPAYQKPSTAETPAERTQRAKDLIDYRAKNRAPTAGELKEQRRKERDAVEGKPSTRASAATQGDGEVTDSREWPFPPMASTSGAPQASAKPAAQSASIPRAGISKPLGKRAGTLGPEVKAAQQKYQQYVQQYGADHPKVKEYYQHLKAIGGA